MRTTRKRQGIRRVDAAIANVQKELDDLPAKEIVQREQLSENLQGLRTLRAAQGQNAQVIQPATPPASPVSPNPKRNALLAFVVALLIGACAVALAERLDRRLHDPRDLERLTGTPLLAQVPGSAFPGAAPDPQLPIVFQTLRDSLTYFNLDVPLTSLLVMSPIKGDGKTSVATNLAVAYARAGKRVILLDADLRSPQVAARMGGESTPGLSEVLTGGAQTEEALQEIEPFGSYLRILAGGSLPPNPSEMLGSARMTSVLADLADLCDLVLIDTAPLLVVSDAFPLLDQVAGIVGVARLEQTSRDAIERAIAVSDKAGGRVLGMVATGGKQGESYGYGFSYGKAYGKAPGLGGRALPRRPPTATGTQRAGPRRASASVSGDSSAPARPTLCEQDGEQRCGQQHRQRQPQGPACRPPHRLRLGDAGIELFGRLGAAPGGSRPGGLPAARVRAARRAIAIPRTATTPGRPNADPERDVAPGALVRRARALGPSLHERDGVLLPCRATGVVVDPGIDLGSCRSGQAERDREGR